MEPILKPTQHKINHPTIFCKSLLFVILFIRKMMLILYRSFRHKWVICFWFWLLWLKSSFLMVIVAWQYQKDQGMWLFYGFQVSESFFQDNGNHIITFLNSSTGKQLKWKFITGLWFLVYKHKCNIQNLCKDCSAMM